MNIQEGNSPKKEIFYILGDKVEVGECALHGQIERQVHLFLMPLADLVLFSACLHIADLPSLVE